MNHEIIIPNRRILVIDDNQAIHNDFRKIFSPESADETSLIAQETALFGETEAIRSHSGFLIDSAFQGQEGLEMVRRSLEKNHPYAMAFIDVRMPPGWDGIETISHIWQEYPDLQVVVCTAYSDYSLDDILVKLGKSDRFVILKKPFDNIEVLQLAHALSEKWLLLQQVNAKTEELERRVVERTQELQTANQKLQTEMEERVKVEDAFRQAQKMEALGQLTGGIAHDFNNLLTIIRGYTEFLMDKEHLDLESQNFLQEIDSAVGRAASLTRQLLTFSRKQIIQPENLNLNEVIGQVVRMLHRILGEDIALEIQAANEVPCVRADRAMIEHILLNLAVNARDAMPKGGRLLISTEAVELSDEDVLHHTAARAGSFVCFSVADSGCGIAPEIKHRLFEPFFTTKEVGKGTGLGLATAYGIVQQHEGWIEVESAPGHGATFKIFLPATSNPIAQAALAVPESQAVGGSETILLVEDEDALRNVARMVLENYGYRVYTADSGVNALKAWPDLSSKVDLLLTDMVMPDGMSGTELATRLQADKPELKVIYSSGYSRDLVGRNGILSDGIHFLPKPYTPGKLASEVRGCLDGNFRAPAMAAPFAMTTPAA